jgi:hypothetical protein
MTRQTAGVLLAGGLVIAALVALTGATMAVGPGTSASVDAGHASAACPMAGSMGGQMPHAEQGGMGMMHGAMGPMYGAMGPVHGGMGPMHGGMGMTPPHGMGMTPSGMGMTPARGVPAPSAEVGPPATDPRAAPSGDIGTGSSHEDHHPSPSLAAS